MEWAISVAFGEEQQPRMVRKRCRYAVPARTVTEKPWSGLEFLVFLISTCVKNRIPELRVNQSIVYIRLTKRSPIYKRVFTLVAILIQLPSNNLSIIFWWKGQVVRCIEK